MSLLGDEIAVEEVVECLTETAVFDRRGVVVVERLLQARTE
ncbi:hypothetical protein [Halorubrum laminariae]|uniref:Uncharacterized protein n=1 Tax=Halorubrum laminariae TaxID=1433523 RepID=A0ABD6C509_9EURY|nr:hypothetical protein [Halorubrum laminariae]